MSKFSYMQKFCYMVTDAIKCVFEVKKLAKARGSFDSWMILDVVDIDSVTLTNRGVHITKIPEIFLPYSCSKGNEVNNTNKLNEGSRREMRSNVETHCMGSNIIFTDTRNGFSGPFYFNFTQGRPPSGRCLLVNHKLPESPT